jgi:hypothetical protein
VLFEKWPTHCEGVPARRQRRNCKPADSTGPSAPGVCTKNREASSYFSAMGSGVLKKPVIFPDGN